MRLKDIMSTPVLTVPPGLSVEGAREAMKRQRVRHLVVKGDDGIAGIVSERDIRRARPEQLVASLMEEDIATAEPTTTVREAANLMRGRTIGCLPVLDKGRLVGIVTVTDLLELIGRGVERPVDKGTRWTLKDRGPGRSAQQRSFAGNGR